MINVLSSRALPRLFLFTAIFFGIFQGCSRNIVPASRLEQGDLLFVVSGEANNITSVTKGVEGLGIDHVAMVSGLKDSSGRESFISVIEAVPDEGVVESSLDGFLGRLSASDAVVVGRVEGLDAEASAAGARRFLGRPYDDLFYPGDSAVYCSELVQLSCVDRAGKRVFDLIPMSFHDSTGIVTPFWKNFYAARGLSVPEGRPGTNPGQISRDPAVRILGRLGK